MDFGLIVAVWTQEPGFSEWLFWRVVAWLGVAAGLTFVIFVHELGHFLVAKACGVKCEKFYVGFDFFEFRIPLTKWKIPRSLFKFQWGETEYGLGSLPLGGYVKMLGQDDDPRNAEAEAARIRASTAGEQVNAASEALAPPSAAEVAVAAKTTAGQTILLDPRSYPAKPVLARMAIISAGVIMNMIFAVVLAAVAFRLGVEKMPAIVGSTSPGGAAWVAGMEPGSKIIQIGQRGKPSELLQWGDIRKTAVLNSGRDVSLLARRPDGQEIHYDVRPTKTPGAELPIIGIGPPISAEINIFGPDFPHLNPSFSTPLKDHDRIVEAAGHKIVSGSDLTTIFAQQPKGSLPLKVERKERTPEGKLVEKPSQSPQIIDVTLQPKPMRDLGLTMKAGPIVALREGSSAVEAGLRVGDTIVEIDGQPIRDPLSLSQRLTPELGSSAPITLVIERKAQGKASQKTITVAPTLPLQSPTDVGANPTSIESIGAAFQVTNEVAGVDSSGPAASAGLAPGDVITQVEFVWADAQAGKKLARFTALDSEPLNIGEGKRSWTEVVALLNLIFPDTKVKLTWQRGKETMSKELLPQDSMTFFQDTRGLHFYRDIEEQKVGDWALAWQLGFREAGEQLSQVLTILHRLVTGRLPVTSVSGPFGIIHLAGSVASQGVAALLIFLTMLSANLAVINFMPIPALDGGHMLFLTAEGIRGKPVDERLQIRLTIAGVICLLSLMVFATAMDIQRWFG